MINDLVGAVAIGRNEGERLRVCLTSLTSKLSRVVYVDSGSTDGSVQLAESLGVTVVKLDMTIHFTAARARNAGAKALISANPDIEFIQFVDGDCEIQAGWIDASVGFLQEHPDYAVACGRRRERFPDASVFNRLCDIEWDTPIGDTASCGGDALIRVSAYREVMGYREALIAGEEPEMCYRLRGKGWFIRRLDKEMALHDAAMFKWKQWWKRHVRAGHAYAESYALHGGNEEKFRRKENISILFWGAFFPLLMIICLLLYPLLAMLLVLVYPIQMVRLHHRYKPQFHNSDHARYSAISNVISKFPQLFGVIKFRLNHLQGKKSGLIEYK